MKKAIIKFFKSYKFNSVFIRIFLTLTLLTVITVSISGLLTIRLISDNLKEKKKTLMFLC